ncbi:hypothetical protein Z052_11690 [Halorubrum sp. C191]|nr:hypothetical protein Z052_11690 [Halorubrum sp. C191]
MSEEHPSPFPGALVLDTSFLRTLGGTDSDAYQTFIRYVKSNECELFLSAVLNARRRQHRIFDIRSSTGSSALAVDSQIGRFDSSGIVRRPKHQFHKIPDKA